MNKTVEGDILALAQQGLFDVVIHGCNCFHVMGAGLAAQVSAQYPGAYEVDKATDRGDRGKLGTYSSFLVGDDFRIVNAYTQYNYGGGMHVDYEAIRQVFRTVASDFIDKRIAYPKIGAGLAGGDWSVIYKIIKEELAGLDHTLVEYV